jgi:hypothetical protein
VTRRVVGVWVRRTVDDPELASALVEDVVDLVSGMEQVDPALVVAPSGAADAAAVAWPGTASVEVGEGGSLAAALAALAAVGAGEVALVVGDVPDLPPLLLGKLFSALTSTEAAACPAPDGRLVAVACGLPAPGWLAGSDVDADTPDALDRLRAVAPRRALHVGAGWHRVRDAADAAALDAGLEGWDATRAWLSRRAR